MYGFGFYASSSLQSEMAMAFLVLHISFQCFNIPLSICATGLHSMSPRASDPELDRYCCDLELGKCTVRIESLTDTEAIEGRVEYTLDISFKRYMSTCAITCDLEPRESHSPYEG